MDYFNGHNIIEANNIGKLDNLSQDEVNNLACGPQDEFFRKLDLINVEMAHYGIEPIDVTNKWNWRAGSYDNVREYLYKRLDLSKKCMSVSKLMSRTIDKVNYLGFINRQSEAMENERAQLKRLGVGKDVDIDEFKKKCKEFVDKLCIQCEKVADATNQKVLITPYININGRHTQIYYDILLSDLTMSVFDNNKCIQKLPLDKIHIIVSESLRHRLNGLRSQMNFTGKYLSDGPSLEFAYISRPYRSESTYSTVCLDKYHDDISKALKKMDLVLVSMLLMQWAQFYNIKVANPYNQPYLSHLGMPGSFSKEYKAVNDVNNVASSCATRLRNFATTLKLNSSETDNMIVKTCNNIDCQLKTNCNAYRAISTRLAILNSEFGTSIEGMIGLIIDVVPIQELNSILNLIVGDELPIWQYCDDEGKIVKEDNLITDVIDKLYNYYLAFKTKEFCGYTYDFLEKYEIIDRVIKVAVSKDTMSDVEVETLMKQWAETQGGR